MTTTTPDPASSVWQGPLDLARALNEADELEEHPLGISPLAIERFVCEAYNASLLSEEGRPVRFQACLLQRGNLPGRARLEFKKDEPLTAEVLRRLSSSLPPSPFAFLACDLAGDVRLLGWTRIEKRRFSLTVETSGAQVEGGLWLRVLGPGLVEAWSTHFRPVSTVFRLSGGTLHSANTNLTDALMAIGLCRDAPSRFLLQIIPEAASLAHGGTFVLLPANLSPTPHTRNGRFCDEPDMGEAVTALLNTSAEAREFNTQRALDLARCIARASAVDGAVILTEKLQLLAFGVVLAPPPDVADPLLVGLDGTPASQGAIRHGTRHVSAARYCAAVPGSRIVVISQDGEIRLLRHVDASKVLVLGPFVDPVPHRLYGTFD